MSDSSYILSCKKCQYKQSWGHRICEKCGPTEALYLGQPPNPNVQISLGCSSCMDLFSPRVVYEVKNLPRSCGECDSHDLGWYNSNSQTWLPSPMLPIDVGSTDIWVKGDFDGSFEGQNIDAGDHNPLNGSLKYPLLITGGQLSNLTKADGPPGLIGGDSSQSPFSQELVSNIEFHFNGGQFLGGISHFALYDWHQISQDGNNSEGKIYGRITGKAYGRLIEPDSIDAQKLKVIDAESASGSDIGRKKSDFFLSSKSIAGTVSSASEGIASLLNYSFLTKSQIQNTSPTKSQEKPTQHPDSPSSANNQPVISEWGCKYPKLLLLLLIPVFILVWFGCGFTHALIGTLVSGLALIPLLGVKLTADPWSPGVANKLGIVLIGVALAIVAYMSFYGASSAFCNTFISLWIWVIAAIVLASLFLLRCWIWIILTIIWVFALLLSCSQSGVSCTSTGSDSQGGVATEVAKFQSPSQPNLDSLQVPNVPLRDQKDPEKDRNEDPLARFEKTANNISNRIKDRFNQTVTNDQDGAIVSDANSHQRVDLEKALGNPGKYFKCSSKGDSPRSYDIYIGGKALFPFDNAQIGSEADAYLSKLVALIKTNPDARLVLIGNSDIVGTDDAKYELSVRRADALANWLVLNNVTSLDKIQIRGAGDLNPIVKDARSELQALNRRVDLRIDCPKE